MMANKEKDSTNIFFQLCNNLQPGDLCHVKNFDLQDVMTAIELMDPKMDSRMKIQRKVMYMTEILKKQLLPLGEDMEYKLLIGIMDETFACLVNWLKGDTLGQTVFINMYMHCTDLIKNKPLKAFCEAIKNIIIFIKMVILKASVSEEEDFYLTSSKMPLDDCMAESKVSGMLKEVDDELSRVVKSKTQSCEMDQIILCLQYRIKFVRNLLLWCIVIKKHIQSGTNKLSKETHSEGARYLGLLTELVDKLIETVNAGEMANEGKRNPTEKEYGLVGFEPYLNLPLLPPAIPRCADIEDRLPAMNYIRDLISRLVRVSEILINDISMDVISAWNFIHHFGSFENSCVLSRSLLLTFYLAQFSFPNPDILGPMNNNSTNNIKIDSLKSSLQSFLVITCWPEIDSVIKLEEKLLVFLIACAESIFQIPITHCLNRSRQRTRLELIIEANWELYEECTKVDHLIRSFINHKNSNSKRVKDIPPIFSSFVAVIQFRSMLDYLISGFQLELFAPQELLSVYFILSESLLKYFVQHCNELEMVQRREQTTLMRVTGVKKSRKRLLEREMSTNLAFISQLIKKLKSYHNMCRGIFLLLSALELENRLPSIMNVKSSSIYSTHRVCYDKRFGALVHRGWFSDTASFDKFQESQEDLRQKSVSEIYELAGQHFDTCRKLIDASVATSPNLFTDSTPEQLSTIAKNNMIVSRLLVKSSKPGQVSLNFDKSNERAFPLIKL